VAAGVNFFRRRRILSAMSRTLRAGDGELVARALGGDGASLAAAFERRRPQLQAAALRILRDRADAQDAVQDTFLIALAHLSELRDPAAFAGWLLAILRNQCLQLLRGRKAEVRVEAIDDEARLDARVEQRLDRHALREWIVERLGALPEPLRLTALLRYFGSYPSYAEVAAILDVPVGTVRSRLADVKRRLADAMLADAGLADDPHDELVDARLATYDEALSGLRWQRRERLLAQCRPDLELVLAAAGAPPRRLRGREHLELDWRDDLQHGVRYELTRAIADRSVSVLEVELHNDPQFPAHCPPGACVVMAHDEAQIERMHVYLSPRPPAPEV
jgi:RNA polymerase sigma factor (sigma-70 family)